MEGIKGAQYWAEVERAVGTGTRCILWGTSTRSLKKHLRQLRALGPDDLEDAEDQDPQPGDPERETEH